MFGVVIGVGMVDQEEFAKMLLRMPVEMKDWLARESRRSGRSQTWLVLHAVEMWMDRLNRSRKRSQCDDAESEFAGTP